MTSVIRLRPETTGNTNFALACRSSVHETTFRRQTGTSPQTRKKMKRPTKENALLLRIRSGQPITARQQLYLTAQLSLPSIMAQISSITMQYIDAAMVGSLGASASASIGLVSTTTWLFMGLCSAVSAGFAVQVAHRLGAKNVRGARAVLRQSLLMALCFSVMLAAIGCTISRGLPTWLGGGDDICHDAAAYFLVFSLSLPFFQLNVLGSAMLRSSGNLYVPSLLNMQMCLLDVVFNMFLIFPTQTYHIFDRSIMIPGAGLGVTGAALGTALAVVVTSAMMLYSLCVRSAELRLVGRRGSFRPTMDCLGKAFRISLPMGAERILMCGAQIMTTVIVAPLGTYAIAANAFAITAESLCYMPGYGVSDAATTLVGQSIGAKRWDLARRFAYITVGSGIAVMTAMGIAMYAGAPFMIGIMTPDKDVLDLGVAVLRIEAFAEPMFAASIVAYGVFVGAGDTLVPATMNLISIWVVRLSLAAILAPTMGLRGVWLAMCLELCFRGIIFLVRLCRGKWIRKL